MLKYNKTCIYRTLLKTKYWKIHNFVPVTINFQLLNNIKLYNGNEQTLMNHNYYSLLNLSTKINHFINKE